MALGLLFWAFITMSMFALVCIVLLFAVRTPLVNDIFLVLMAVYAIAIAALNASALPDNFVLRQLLSWAVGLVGVGGVAARFFTRQQRNLFRGLVAGSVVVGLVLLFLV